MRQPHATALRTINVVDVLLPSIPQHEAAAVLPPPAAARLTALAARSACPASCLRYMVHAHAQCSY